MNDAFVVGLMRPFISLKFLDEKLQPHGKSSSEFKYSCGTATVKMGDNMFMVMPSEPPEEPMAESEGQVGSPGAFQWTVYEITRADRDLAKKNEFRYRGQKLNCAVSCIFEDRCSSVSFLLNLEPICFVAQGNVFSLLLQVTFVKAIYQFMHHNYIYR
jgi:hypothetical protein